MAIRKGLAGNDREMKVAVGRPKGIRTPVESAKQRYRKPQVAGSGSQRSQVRPARPTDS